MRVFEAADGAAVCEGRFGSEVAGSELAEELVDGVVPRLEEPLPEGGLELVERLVGLEGGVDELLEKGGESGAGIG
jgi:hypothetical protein